MHEASLAQAALDLALDTAREHGADRITAINLTVGTMAEADADTLAFWVGVLAEDSPAAGAAIHVTEVPAQAQCHTCGRTYPVEPPRWSVLCERCGEAGELRSGRELNVASIEVE